MRCFLVMRDRLEDSDGPDVSDVPKRALTPMYEIEVPPGSQVWILRRSCGCGKGCCSDCSYLRFGYCSSVITGYFA